MSFKDVLETRAVEADHQALRAQYDAGRSAGRAGESLSGMVTGAFRNGWTAGDVERRARAGEVLAFVCHGSRCGRCGAANYGLRAGCRCWPDIVPDEAKGYTMEWGALVLDVAKTDGSSRFAGRTELRQALATGKPILDALSGKAIHFK